MIFLIDAIQLILLTLAGGILLYLSLLGFLAALSKTQKTFEARNFRKFAIVVPSHDEEKGIAATLTAIGAMEYPREQFRTIVIADNCSDSTAEIARSVGVEVLERTDLDHRGKGYALRWCFDLLTASGRAYDAYVVIDADSAPSSNFLNVMNWYLENGAAAIQASDLVEPGNRTWSAQMTRIGFLLHNFVRPLGRRSFGGTAGLRGNGMCFSREVFQQVPWSAFSIAEDLEYGLALLMRGITVTFAPEAVVYAIMPSTAGNAMSQRARWEGSRLQLIRLYAKPLLRAGITRPSIACIDAFADLVTPATVNLLAFIGGMGTLSGLLWLGGLSPTPIYVWIWGGFFLIAMVYVLLGLWIAGADGGTYKALLHVPRYAVWKLLLYLRMTRRWKSNEWVRTTRE